jgi:hypothetical protein
MPITEQGMVADRNRARILTIDLNLVTKDFLNTHSRGKHCYGVAPSDAVMRQPGLPDDAYVLWTRLDQADTAREDALREAKEYILAHSADDGALVARIDAALAAPPARNLVVGIESAAWREVALGEEPALPFDPTAYFAPPTKE